MVILRSLLKYNVTLQVLIGTTQGRSLRDSLYKGMSEAIYYYINIQKTTLALPVFPSAGVVASVPPVPGVGTAGLTVPVPSPEILEEMFKSKGLDLSLFLNPKSYIDLYESIADWLQPMTASISPVSVPPTMTGTGPVTFPAMRFLGIPAWAYVTGNGILGNITDMTSFYEYFSDMIFAGLLANFIPPISTVGTAIPPTGAYTGVTIAPWVFIDIIDNPIGSVDQAALDALLSLLGLAGLDDDSLASKQQEIDDAGQPDAGEQDSCQLILQGDSWIQNPDCSATCVSQIYTSGNTTCVSADTSATNIFTSAATDFVNQEYLLTSAIPEFDIPIPEYNDGIANYKNDINIVVYSPTVIAEASPSTSEDKGYFTLGGQ